MANHEQVTETIREMSVLELSGLVRAIEEGFDVTVAAPVAVVSAAGNTNATTEKTEFDVELTSAGSPKIEVVRAAKEATGLELKDVKGLVGGAPKVTKETLPKEEAEKLKEQSEEVGVTVELK